MIAQELAKNKAIYELNKSFAATGFDTTVKTLDLASQKLKNIFFLPKLIQEFNNLKELDLSNSDLRSTAAVQ